MIPQPDSESGEGISERRKALQERRKKGLSEAAKRAEMISEEPEDDEDDEDNEEKMDPESEAAHIAGDLDQNRGDEQAQRRVNPRANNIVTYESIEDLVTDPAQHGITRVDYPVHVFPLELFPPEIVDRSTGRKTKLSENTIQPLLYMDGLDQDDTSLILCDCECPEWCTVVFPALVAGFGACAHVIPDTVNAVCGANCMPALPNCVCCDIPNCGGLNCQALVANCIPAADMLPDCLGCVSGVGESAAACAAAVVGGVTDCAGTATACAASVADGVTNCYGNTVTTVTECYASIPPCNIHNILLQELYSCYYQVTRGCC